MSELPSNTNLPGRGLVKSPCIRNCCLNRKDICMGCFRHLDEITGWGRSTDEQKKQILILANERKKNYKLVIPFERSTSVK